MGFFRTASSPLIDENPPTTARQALVLATLLSGQNDPDPLYKVSRAYAAMLIRSQTPVARWQDFETGMIELNALCMEQQGQIDLLLQANNAQQVQHAQELLHLRQRDSAQQVQLARELQQLTEELLEHQGRNDLLEQVMNAQRRELQQLREENNFQKGLNARKVRQQLRELNNAQQTQHARELRQLRESINAQQVQHAQELQQRREELLEQQRRNDL
jgi:uncharacterized membrane protein YheB (UPF0754 family)